MPGPPPKDPALRQRRNRPSTATTLPPESACRRRRVPPLPPGEWSEGTLAWWSDLWRSPQATRWTKAMLHELVMLARIRERWVKTGDPRDAAEYRMHRRDFGLTELDMRRLGWTIAEEEPRATGGGRGQARRPAAVQDDEPDPRGVLRAVK